MFAHSDGMCCSAAYAIVSGTFYISATADATIGSIGTILPLMDISGLWQAMGIKPDYISERYPVSIKAFANPQVRNGGVQLFKPLTGDYTDVEVWFRAMGKIKQRKVKTSKIAKVSKTSKESKE